MKPIYFAYDYNGQTYYAEGFSEPAIRKALENKLKIKPGTLSKGRKPDYVKELKEIWNKKNPKMKLFLTKEQTSSKEEIELNKKKQHCLYELELFLKEDKNFLMGTNDIILLDPDNKAMLYPNTGFPMCYSIKNPHHPDDIYRFPKGQIDAYWHIRNNIISLGIQNWTYKRTECTVLEILDSFIAGFGSLSTIDFSNKNVKPNSPHKLPLNLLYKNESK